MNFHGTRWSATGHSVRQPADPAEQLASDLSDEDRKLIDWMADQVVERRLTTPAVFLLESSKPLNFIASQLLIVLTPLLGAFMPRIPYDRAVALLEKRASVELLLRAVEAREDQYLTERRARGEKARTRGDTN